MSTSDQEKPATPGRRGRKASGKTRGEIEQASSKKRRQRLVREGKAEVKTFVETLTKERLNQLKEKMDVGTIGEVIDALVKQASHD